MDWHWIGEGLTNIGNGLASDLCCIGVGLTRIGSTLTLDWHGLTLDLN